MFFLKLQTQCSIPAKTVEVIITEMNNLYSLGLEKCLNLLCGLLLAENINPEKVNTILNEVKKNDIIHTALNTDTGSLRSQHKRRNFYKQHFNYVEAVEMHLGQNHYGKLSVFHYVSVKSTLAMLLKDESVLLPQFCTWTGKCWKRVIF